MMRTGLSHAKIYKIYSAKTDRVYIGSTCVPDLRIRLTQHLLDYWKYKSGETGHGLASFDIFDVDEQAKIELVEKFPTDSKTRLLAREQYWIDRAGSLAVNRGVAFSRGEFNYDYSSHQDNHNNPGNPDNSDADTNPRGRQETRGPTLAREATPVPAQETFSVPGILDRPSRNNQVSEDPTPCSETITTHHPQSRSGSRTILHPQSLADRRCPCGGKITTNPIRHAGSVRHQKYISSQAQPRATQDKPKTKTKTKTNTD